MLRVSNLRGRRNAIALRVGDTIGIKNITIDLNGLR